MDRKDPSGCKVGLLDDYQIWCHLVDPYSHDLTLEIVIEGVLGMHLTNMLKFFIPGTTENAANKMHDYR
eukprot:8975543-Ditylum_brightwellii.AAC.1